VGASCNLSEENMAQIYCCVSHQRNKQPGDPLGPHRSFNVRRWGATLPTVRIGYLFKYHGLNNDAGCFPEDIGLSKRYQVYT
jgi:hypothetical protein